MANLLEKYRQEIVPALKEKFGYKNVMAIPKLTKISLNCGVGKANEDKDCLQQAVTGLTAITGQKAIITKARKSIANFKLRQGMPIGATVTLRGMRMYEFLDRLISIAVPRVRDFRGFPATAFDGRGNMSLGITEQSVFPEIDPDKIKSIQGLQITLVTTAKTNEEGRELLRLFGLPFEQEES